MKHITSIYSHMLLASVFALLLNSCSSDSNPEPKIEEKSKEQIDTLEVPLAPDTEAILIVEEPIVRDYKQMSNGLEYKVAQYFQDQFKKGQLTHIVKGIGRKMDPKKSKVYLDKKLYSNNDLGFFYGKYPEFLEATTNAFTDTIVDPNSELTSMKLVNCESFLEGKAYDYLLNRENYEIGDLQIVISKTFYFKGHYYVHAWQINASTSLYHRNK